MPVQIKGLKILVTHSLVSLHGQTIHCTQTEANIKQRSPPCRQSRESSAPRDRVPLHWAPASQPAKPPASPPATVSQPASQPAKPASQPSQKLAESSLPHPRSEVPICSAELSAEFSAEFGAESDAGFSAGKQIQQVFSLSQTCRIYVWKSMFTR